MGAPGDFDGFYVTEQGRRARRRRRIRLVAVSAVVGAALLAVVIASAMGGEPRTSPPVVPPPAPLVPVPTVVPTTVPRRSSLVAVPDLWNEPTRHARGVLDAAGFSVEVQESAYIGLAEGVVWSQTPAAGTMLKRRSTVVIRTTFTSKTMPLEAARALWQAHGVRDYAFDYTLYHRPRHVTRANFGVFHLHRITVRNETVSGVVNLLPKDRGFGQPRLTVAQLFELVAHVEGDRSVTATVRYHPGLGIPVELDVTCRDHTIKNCDTIRSVDDIALGR